MCSYGVAQRRREFGIRTALGATAPSVVGLVVREGQRTIAVGLVLGVTMALIAGQWLSPFLFETSARDPLVLGLVILVLVAATALGSLIPAWRAARVDPAATLRTD